MKMPATGRKWDDVKTDLLGRGSDDAKWRDGKTAVYVFNAGDKIAAIQKEAYTAYMSENGLGPAAFPSLAKMEQEVVSMGLDLLHGPAGSTGAMTSRSEERRVGKECRSRGGADTGKTPRDGIKHGGDSD